MGQGGLNDQMAVSYQKLYHLLSSKGMSTVELRKQAGFSGNIMTRIRRNHYISLDSIEKICLTLQCTVDDILEFTMDKEEEGMKK